MIPLLLALSLALVVGCGADADSGSPGADSGEAGVDCGGIYTWETVGAGFIYTWCTPCHSPTLSGEERRGAPEGVDFGSYDDVLTHADRIELRVFEGTMPPSGGPDDDDLAQLRAWFDCRLPE